jgi:arylsulfatase A-like enzyme
VRSAQILALGLVAGVVWLGVELLQVALSEGYAGLLEAVRDAGRLLPWQLALFALLGLSLIAAARMLPIGSRAIIWCLAGLPSFVFLGTRVGEGALRRHSPAVALLALVAAAGLIALALGLTALLGRGLPERLRERWPLAASVGWVFLFVPMCRRSGPALSLGFPPEWSALVTGPELLAACTALFLVLLLGGLHTRRAAAGCLLLIAGLPLTSRDAAARTQRHDVIVLLIDTLRADHLGAGPDGTSLTPHLDGLASESVRFERAFSPANRTFWAMPGILTGLPAEVLGTRLPEAAETLAEQLQRAGYATIGISANPLVSAYYGYDQGFDVLVEASGWSDFLLAPLLRGVGSLAPGPAYRLGLARGALYYGPVDAIRRRALLAIERSPGPTFLYLQTMDMHGPYLPPARFLPPDYEPGDFFSYFPFLQLEGQGVLGSAAFRPQLENLRQRYRAELRFTDEEIGRLMEGLRAQSRWEESLVWVLSDHGEAFGERDEAGHGGEKTTLPVLQVPLLLKPPRSWEIAPRDIDTPVSTLDLVPTTLSLLGLASDQPTLGTNLAPGLRQGQLDPGRIVVSHSRAGPRAVYSAILGSWKLDLRTDAEGRTDRRELFDLERDPYHLRDLALSHPEQVAELETAIEAYRAKTRTLRLEGEKPGGDLRVLERLRRLGYVD